MAEGPEEEIITHTVNLLAPFKGEGRATFTTKGIRISADVPMDSGTRLVITLGLGLTVALILLSTGVFCIGWVATFWIIYFVLGLFFRSAKVKSVPYDTMEEAVLRGATLLIKYKVDGKAAEFRMEIIARDLTRVKEIVGKDILKGKVVT
jgi:hypothetical protein